MGYPAKRIGERGDREIVYVPNVYVPFPAPILRVGLNTVSETTVSSTTLSEFFGLHQVLEGELSEFLSAY